MNISPSFSAKNWIEGSCGGGAALRTETLEAVSSFTLMWNFFEGALCGNHADVKTFCNLAERMALEASVPAEVARGVQFWAARYLTDSEFNYLFEGLRFRKPDRREHVEAVLRGEKNDPKSQLLAVMIIIYRLRNNLFHGLKEINTLNEQVPNLLMGCQSLASILAASDLYIFTSARSTLRV